MYQNKRVIAEIRKQLDTAEILLRRTELSNEKDSQENMHFVSALLSTINAAIVGLSPVACNSKFSESAPYALIVRLTSALVRKERIMRTFTEVKLSNCHSYA